MIVDTVLTNAKAYFKKQVVDCSIAIEEGKIHKIGKESQMPHADEKIDLHNLLVLPGLIDPHVHLRDEGKFYKEDFSTGTQAAAAGGFTTVLDMPNNEPVTMGKKTLEERMKIASKKIFVNVGFYSAFPKSGDEIADIVGQGAIGFKLFMANQVGGLDIDDDQQLQDAFSIVSQFRVPVAVHAEDKESIALSQETLEKDNQISGAAFLLAHSEAVELKAVERLLKDALSTNVNLHFCHISSREGLNAIVAAKKTSKNVTCEVTPNHLLLSDINLEDNQMLVMMPPPRSKSTIEALWKGVINGYFDVMGSDHAPHALYEKTANSVWDIKVGVPGLETTLPLMLTAVKKNWLSLTQALDLMAENPAKIFNLKDRGSLEQGKIADLIIVDYKRVWRIQAANFKSKAKFSPYEDWEVVGKPLQTYVKGTLVYDDNEIIVKAGTGEVIRRSTS